PAADAEDILVLLPGWVRRPEPAPAEEAQVLPLWDGPDGEKILELLGSHALSLDEIAGGTGWELPRVLAALGELEARGALRALPGSHYAIDQRA
ncbi:MAG: hypothetical protein FD126_2888, partial [Elusimicrobia bacterium]